MIKTHALRFGFIAVAAFAVACGSTGGGTDAGTDAGTTTGGTDAGNNMGSMDAGSETFCDGFGATDSASDTVLVDTFTFSNELKTEGCSANVAAFADGDAILQVGGIYELGDENVAAATVIAVTCADLGITESGAPTFTNAPGTPPTGAATVAASLQAKSTTPTTIYGIVTAVYGPTGKAGEMYLQDADTGTPVMGSGVEVYFPKSAGGLPTAAAALTTPPAIGDVVAVSNVKWSPFNGANEFEATSTSTVTHVGTSTLPTPAMLPANMLGTSTLGAAGYEGMRVIVTNGGDTTGFTVKGSETSNDCPMGVTKTITGG